MLPRDNRASGSCVAAGWDVHGGACAARVTPSSLARAYFFSDRYLEAFRWVKKHLRDAPHTRVALRIGAASAAFSGMDQVAQQLGDRLERIDPAFRVSRLEDYIGPYRLPEYVEKLKQGLRLAGLPE